MPYRWLPPAQPDAPRRLEIWPHQSLAPRGFTVMISATAFLLAVPLLAVLATPAFWMLLPFLALAITALWLALSRSRKDRQIREILTLEREVVRLEQAGPKGRLVWQDNPYWVEVRHFPAGGPVEHYLTLKGPAGREVEIGVYLAPEERQALYRVLAAVLPQR